MGTAEGAQELLLSREAGGKYGSFSETFKLPSNVDTENMEATYHQGIIIVNFELRNNTCSLSLGELKVVIPKIRNQPVQQRYKQPQQQPTHNFQPRSRLSNSPAHKRRMFPFGFDDWM